MTPFSWISQEGYIRNLKDDKKTLKEKKDPYENYILKLEIKWPIFTTLLYGV